LLEDVIELINKGSELEKQKKSINILVVDDEEMVRQLLSEIFKMLGHKVVTCKDGAEAVETYKKSHKDMDIVVLDMEMPKLSGKDTFFAMRTINPDVKVLLASGFSIEGEAQSLIEAGAKGFVQKPFNISDLSKSLNDVLRGE
jgi:CheY-like chemotaxis protein